jgi:hypothetical protein
VRYPYCHGFFRMRYPRGCTQECCNLLFIVEQNPKHCLGTVRRSQVFGGQTRIDCAAFLPKAYLSFTSSQVYYYLFCILLIVYLFVKIVVLSTFCHQLNPAPTRETRFYHLSCYINFELCDLSIICPSILNLLPFSRMLSCGEPILRVCEFMHQSCDAGLV